MVLVKEGEPKLSGYTKDVLAEVKAKNPAEPEFHQAVTEVLESLDLVLQRRPEYRKAKIVERIVEPERVIMFRVPWVDDKGDVQVNRANGKLASGTLSNHRVSFGRRGSSARALSGLSGRSADVRSITNGNCRPSRHSRKSANPLCA